MKNPRILNISQFPKQTMRTEEGKPPLLLFLSHIAMLFLTIGYVAIKNYAKHSTELKGLEPLIDLEYIVFVFSILAFYFGSQHYRHKEEKY